MRKISLLLGAALLLPLSVGCSKSSQMVRGQSPADMGQYSPNPCPSPYGGDSYDPCDPFCRGGRQPRVNYWTPQDLSYPQGQQPAIVQYPYYTLKGPDCFFHN